MLTAADFKIHDCVCPSCRRPARVYERGGSYYLRCAWEDCPTARGSLVPTMETFFRIIEQHERGLAQ